ncbi:MAG: type IV toxin-antitoxin system AbiEi family antitoxin [Planctomycetales bacterium]
MSHYSAMDFHGLTEQIPKTTYINFEQALASTSTGRLSQTSIEGAFKRKVRTTQFIAETHDFRVVMLNGKNTGYLGVIEAPAPSTDSSTGETQGTVRVTNLERTLIDITVRPVYSGGVHEVLQAFRAAKPSVSINRLAAMLQQLNYIYPYHQAIGYYLDRAGYSSLQLDLLRKFPMEFDFYLAHQINDPVFDKNWRIYVPSSL